jgi:thiamine-phosphate pyrophosphorylase
MADAKPRCRLYLQLPAPLTAKLESQLTEALAQVAPACVLLCDNGQTSEKVPGDNIIDLVQGAGVACLIENDMDACEHAGADGVHLPADKELYARARALLGESASIGVGCGLDRHQAMQLAEAGADYVAFGVESGTIDHFDQYTEILSWWSEIFVVPCVAWNVDDAAHAERLAQTGADFIAPPPSIWQSDSAIATIVGIDNAIRSARRPA